MARLGLWILMVTFIGVPAFVVLGASRNMSLAILTHTALVIGISLAVIIRKKSLKMAWLALQPAQGFGAIHPAVVLFGGILFLVGGLSIAIVVEPGKQPDSMTKGDQIYFGCLFACAGAGLALIAINAWLIIAREKARNPFVSKDR